MAGVVVRKGLGGPFTGAVLAATVMFGACGGDRSGGPAGAPNQVVGQAADLTLAAGTAGIKIASPNGQASGVIDFQARSGRLLLQDTLQRQSVTVLIAAGTGYLNRGSGWTRLASVVPDALAGGDPFANLDLLRGSTRVLSDGGAEIDGASTLRYTLTVDPVRALAATPPDRQVGVRRVLQGRASSFAMDVWIDSGGRARRVQLPTDLRSTTPATRVDRMPVATDVDYVSFGVAVPEVAPPAEAG